MKRPGPFLLPAAAMVFAALAHTPLQAQFPRAVTEPAAVDRGAKIYAGSCARCHGADERGTFDGPDLLRSTAVLHDRREQLHGAELKPLLEKPPHSMKFNDTQIADLSQFLTAGINKILRSGYNDVPTQMLSGDASAGEAFFNGAGGCSKCHSVNDDLKGIGSRLSPPALQQKFLFPNAGVGKKLRQTAKVTLPNGKVITGDVVRIDDFNITLADKSGALQTIHRNAGVKVTITDPYAAHNQLLDKYTDADIHNLTTYLDGLK